MASDERLGALGSPSAEGLTRVAEALGIGAGGVEAVRRLSGGGQAVSHALLFERVGWVVLKRWPTHEPAAATGEFARLQFAHSSGLPAPSPLAVDPDGDWFGWPALVMAHLAGKVVLRAAPGPWIAKCAETLVGIHSASLPTSLDPALAVPHAGIAWTPLPPERFPRTPRVRRLLDAVESLQADHRARAGRRVLLHHDFRQHNVLWEGDRLTGVVDWHDARVGPAASDVAYATVDLVRTNGVRAADLFVAAYEAAGGSLEDLPRWQALWLASQLPWMHRWTAIRLETSGKTLTRTLVARRLRDFADKVIAQL